MSWEHFCEERRFILDLNLSFNKMANTSSLKGKSEPDIVSKVPRNAQNL